MKKLFLSTLIVLGMTVTSCDQKPTDKDPMAETGRTQRTENLLASLKELSTQDKFMFGHHEKMVAEYGLGETLKREYGDVGCHNNLKGPRRFGSGPVYILDQTGGAMKACGDGRRGGSRFEFELRFARPLLENDERYRRYDYGWNELYVPVGDPTLPVLDACTGEEMTFTTEVEKAMFIKKLELDNRKDR